MKRTIAPRQCYSSLRIVSFYRFISFFNIYNFSLFFFASIQLFSVGYGSGRFARDRPTDVHVRGCFWFLVTIGGFKISSSHLLYTVNFAFSSTSGYLYQSNYYAHLSVSLANPLRKLFTDTRALLEISYRVKCLEYFLSFSYPLNCYEGRIGSRAKKK